MSAWLYCDGGGPLDAPGAYMKSLRALDRMMRGAARVKREWQPGA